jgi:hypothetical protein
VTIVKVMTANSGVVVAGDPEPYSLLLGGVAALAGLGRWAWRRRSASRVG